MFANAMTVDLETMGNGPLTAILSIGAVRFTMEGCTEQFEADEDSRLRFAVPIDTQRLI